MNTAAFLRMQGLRKLCGYVEDGSNGTVTISQDDATKYWTIRIGKTKSYSDRTFFGTLDMAIADIPKGDSNGE